MKYLFILTAAIAIGAPQVVFAESEVAEVTEAVVETTDEVIEEEAATLLEDGSIAAEGVEEIKA